jgi:hypothetical protein
MDNKQSISTIECYFNSHEQEIKHNVCILSRYKQLKFIKIHFGHVINATTKTSIVYSRCSCLNKIVQKNLVFLLFLKGD